MTPLVVLLAVMFTAFACSLIARALRLPKVLGFIAAGVILGFEYFQPFIIPGLGVVQFLADIGITLMFFFVGIEINPSVARRQLDSSLKLGLWSSFFPFMTGIVVATLFGARPLQSILVGLCSSIAAQAVTVELLEETTLLKTGLGERIIAAGTIADLVQIFGIGALFAILPATHNSPLGIILNILLFAIAIILLKVGILPMLLRILGREPTSSTLFMAAILTTLLMGVLGETLGFSAILGALFAGIIVRRSFNVHQVSSVAREFRDLSFGFLVPVFFAFVGLNVDLSRVETTLGFGATLAVASLVATVTGAVFGMRGLRIPLRDKMVSGIALSSKGDLEIVIATIALDAGIIGLELFSALIIMSILTMFIAPALFYTLVKMRKPAS